MLLLRESEEEEFLGKSLLDEFLLARENLLLIASSLETFLDLLSSASVGSNEDESESQSKISLGKGLGPPVAAVPTDEWRLAYSSFSKFIDILISSALLGSSAAFERRLSTFAKRLNEGRLTSSCSYGALIHLWTFPLLLAAVEGGTSITVDLRLGRGVFASWIESKGAVVFGRW